MSARIFVSFAAKDRRWFTELNEQLASVCRQIGIEILHSESVAPGSAVDWAEQHWSPDIQMALLLVSARYTSDKQSLREMRAIMQHQAQGLTVVPLIVSPVNWRNEPYGHLECYPRGGKAIVLEQLYARRARLWADIAAAIGQRLAGPDTHRPIQAPSDHAVVPPSVLLRRHHRWLLVLGGAGLLAVGVLLMGMAKHRSVVRQTAAATSVPAPPGVQGVVKTATPEPSPVTVKMLPVAKEKSAPTQPTVGAVQNPTDRPKKEPVGSKPQATKPARELVWSHGDPAQQQEKEGIEACRTGQDEAARSAYRKLFADPTRRERVASACRAANIQLGEAPSPDDSSE